MKKYIFFFSFILAGCQTKTYMDTGPDPEAVSQKAKALIVMRATAKAPNGNDVAIAATWRNIDTNHYFTTNEQVRFLLYSSAHDKVQAYTVEPGRYVLSDIDFTSPGFLLWGERKYYARNLSPIVSFEVLPGEQLYIGDLTFNLQNTKLLARAIRLDDRYESIVKALENETPGSSPKLTKRLMKLSKTVELVQLLGNIGGGILENSPLA